MADHFSAFSFVDRIVELDPGRRAVGQYAIPSGIEAFPSCLVAEAVGQLAAWVAMSKIEFRGRPVAALATETRFLASAAPGDTLRLAVDIDQCDDEAVAYAGRASVNGKDVIELIDCLGPMLPVQDFDSPELLAARFDLIRAEGARPGAFHGVVLPHVRREAGVPGAFASAEVEVPASAPFFGDHFPRRSVFPATLLLDTKIKLAMSVANEATFWPPDTELIAARMTHVKVRSFIPPGATLEIEADLVQTSVDAATAKLAARMDGKTAATARLDIVARERAP